MSNVTVYVGDNTKSFRHYVLNIDPNAEEANSQNWNISNEIVYLYTQNHTNKELIQIFLDAKEIIFYQPVTWSSDESKFHTIGWLEYINTLREVKMLRTKQIGLGPVAYESQICDLPDFLNPTEPRKTEDPQIWVVGCSYTNGHGLADRNTRFGQLFANELNMPVSFLTMNGASNQWAADQILKSDIRTNDIVFWGITGVARSTLYTKERPWPITINMLDKEIPVYKQFILDNRKIAPMRRMITEEFLLSDHSFYETVNHVDQVYNYLKKLNTKFLLGYFADLDFPYLDHMGRMMHYITNKNDPRVFVIKPEYPWIDMIRRGLSDTNYDNAREETLFHHPGPGQHQAYSKALLQRYSELYIMQE